MSRNQIDELTKLLTAAQQLVSDLDCGPLECHACVDTDDIAYIELNIDGDGAALSLADWAFALRTLVDLAHTDWAVGQLYEAFRQALCQTSAHPDEALPEWEEVERLMEEQARVRRVYKNLLAFLERPDTYAHFLDTQVRALLAAHPRLTPQRAKATIAAVALDKLQEELELAQGEKATPEFAQMYDAWISAGGAGFGQWLRDWSGSDSLCDDLHRYRNGHLPGVHPDEPPWR